MLDSILEQLAGAIVRHQAARAEQRILNIQAAAKYLGRTPASVRHLVQNGTLRPCRFGDSTRLYFDRVELDLLIEAAKTQAPVTHLSRPAEQGVRRMIHNAENLQLDHAKHTTTPRPRHPDARARRGKGEEANRPRHALSAEIQGPARKHADEPDLLDEVVLSRPDVSGKYTH